MKEAYRKFQYSKIYATRVDWMMSGDDSEETSQRVQGRFGGSLKKRCY